MHETQEYLRRELIGTTIKSVPNVSFKAVYETNGDLIGASLANVMNVETGEGLEIEYISHYHSFIQFCKKNLFEEVHLKNTVFLQYLL